MYRDIIRQLTTLVESRAQPQLYLTGPKFSGKSLALVCLVNQMRSFGWLVRTVVNRILLLRSFALCIRHPGRQMSMTILGRHIS